MSNIVPVSDLRNYNEVLSRVKENSPVYLTKNGRGVYAVITIDEYEKLQSELKLLSELNKGKLSGETEGWISNKDAKTRFGI